MNIIIITIKLFDIYSKNGDIIYNSDRAKEKMKYLIWNSFRLLRLVNNIIDIAEDKFDTIFKRFREIYGTTFHKSEGRWYSSSWILRLF